MIKTFHFGPEGDYALLVLSDSWLRLTALLEDSTSILEGGGLDLSWIRANIECGDRALIALLRRDRAEERMS